MKERESETESWCRSLSKKTLFLSPSVSLSLCFSGCFDVFRQTHSSLMVEQACRHNTTDEECQLVVRGSHMLLISLSFSSPTVVSLSLYAESFVLLSFLLFSPPPSFAVGVNLRSIISQTFDCQAWCIYCASEPFAHSNSCPYLGHKESRVVL